MEQSEAARTPAGQVRSHIFHGHNGIFHASFTDTADLGDSQRPSIRFVSRDPDLGRTCARVRSTRRHQITSAGERPARILTLS